MSDRKVAMITGASRGIGAATALEFAKRGYDLAITSPNGGPIEDIAAKARAAGAKVEIILGDLSDTAFFVPLVDRFVEKLGRIDVLVNNAAWRDLVTMRKISMESWEKTLRICLTAPAFLAKSAAEHMERRKQGVILMVSSVMSTFGTGISPAYIAAKGGMDGLTYDLAALYGPMGIRVISVRPGAIDTEMSRDYAATADQEGFAKRRRDHSEEMIPLRRWGQPEEIARAMAALCSDDASYLTGTTVTIDGGWAHQFIPISLKREQHPDEFP